MAISRHQPPPSSTAVLVVRRRHPSSAMPNDLKHRPIDSAGPSAHLTHHRRCLESMCEAQKNLHHQPIGDLFQSWLALSLARQGCVTIVHACIAALYSMQINCATLKWLPSARNTQTWPWARAIFSRQNLLDIIRHDMVANFWTAPTAWFQGGTGPNSEDSPCSSVTSYWCSAKEFYLTIFKHRTPLGKPLSRPSDVSNHNFLSNSSWGVWQSRWCRTSVTNLVNFLWYGFWEKIRFFGSTTLSGGFCANRGA